MVNMCYNVFVTHYIIEQMKDIKTLLENGGENMKQIRIIEDIGRGVLSEDLAPKKGDIKENENRTQTELRPGKPAGGSEGK